MENSNGFKSKQQPIMVVIGGGPAGLMAAETLALAGAEVHIYDAMPSIGRKFLRAGVGGLNLTHSEPFEQFISRYGSRRDRLEPMLREFGPDQMVSWANGLGFETFVGTSGRVFPAGMKASPPLRAWLKQLEVWGVIFHTSHAWVGISTGDRHSTMMIEFESPQGQKSVPADAAVLALGGGSWPRLGSTGGWVSQLEAHGVPVSPLKPANCGFDTSWSGHFKSKYDGAVVKPVVLNFHGRARQGEFIITQEGMEGSLIYTFSAPIRDEIENKGQATIQLDLAPGWSIEKLVQRLSRPRGSRSMSSHLEKAVGIKGVKAGLLWEFVSREDFTDPEKLAAAIKLLPVSLIAARPLAEAISSAGGVRFETLDANLMLRALPGVFCAGEMLDWEAPTGGYLLTACMSTGKWAAKGAWKWVGKAP